MRYRTFVDFTEYCAMSRIGGENVRYILYSRPILEDLSQGSRIRFIRIFRQLTQENVSDDLGITGENKRRTMTRYEKGDRKPSKERLNEIAKILLINENIIKKIVEEDMTLIIVSHEEEFIKKVSNYIYQLKNGNFQKI